MERMFKVIVIDNRKPEVKLLAYPLRKLSEPLTPFAIAYSQRKAGTPKEQGQ